MPQQQQQQLPRIADDALLQNFVNPALCKQLYDHGLYFAVKFFWVVRGATLQVISQAFDPDDYYSDAMMMMDAASPVESILPAYTVKDLEKLLPSYALAQCNGSYALKLHRIPQLTANSLRMPDVFAHMLLLCIRHDVINLEHANMVLMQEGPAEKRV